MRSIDGGILLGIALSLLFCSCSRDRQETPYGDAEPLAAYRAAVDPLISEINEVEQSLRAMAVGSTGRATGENLAAACQVLDGRLTAVLVQLDAMDPPRKLRAMHADMRTAVDLRLRACQRIAAGWQIEREASFEAAQSAYLEAEALLSEARMLLVAVGAVLSEVDVALDSVGARSPTA